MTNLYDFTARRLDGTKESLARYSGDVLLIVNTASQCGFTSQYAGLEAVHRAYTKRGFNVLGFPCNQFGKQEPGDESAIRGFCDRSYGISFPMFAKVEVNGDGAHPLYRFLKAAKPGFLGLKSIKWNFTKFLVDRQGEVVAIRADDQAASARSADREPALMQTRPVARLPDRVTALADDARTGLSWR